jgi:type II secretion system protein G
MLYRKRAFTLIELLVVMAIIGILATIMIIAYTNAEAKSRDNKRKADIQAISSAVEMFHADIKNYPTGSPYQVRSSNSTAWSGFGTKIGAYITNPLPIDPKPMDTGNKVTWQENANDFIYTFISTGNSYILAAKLEVSNDGNGADFSGKTLIDINMLPQVLTTDVNLCSVSTHNPASLYFVGSNLVIDPNCT